MNYYSPDDSHLTLRALRFVRRMFIMRQLGTFLCFIPILSVLLATKSAPGLSALLAVNDVAGAPAGAGDCGDTGLCG